METTLDILVVIAAVAVLVSLIVGLFALIKPNPDPKMQNKMMQMRIFFQFIALIILGIIFYIRQQVLP